MLACATEVAVQRSYDVIVIGGGVVGLTTAAQLRGLGAGSVALLERAHLGAGESGGAAGLLRQHDAHPRAMSLAAASRAEFASFQERTGRDIGYRACGVLFVVAAEERPAVEPNVAMQAQAGVPVSLLEAEELRKLEPRGRFEDAIAVWEPGAACIEPVRTLGALGAEATRLGVEIELGIEVLSIVTEASDAVRRVSGVETSQGLIAARQVVLAAGAWSARLASSTGVELPLEVVRRSRALVHPPVDFGDAHPALVDVPGDFCALPSPAGTYVAPLHAPRPAGVDPDTCDPGASGEFLLELRARLQRRLPAYGRSILAGGGSVPCCVCPDQVPVAGAPAGLEGLFVASGCGADPFGTGPALARGLAEFVVHGTTRSLDLDFFDPERFRRRSAHATVPRYGLIG
jgi:sarcosine oxidase, subunit beta